jgi:hypothetical protein
MLHEFPADAVGHLAGQMGLSVSSNPDCPYQVLEASLTPLVRSALRRGLGQPALVRWVRSQVPAAPFSVPGQSAEVSRLTGELTRKLAGVLLAAHRPSEAACETVVGA